MKKEKTSVKIANFVEQRETKIFLEAFVKWFNDYREENKYCMPTFPLLSIAEYCVMKENERSSRVDKIVIRFSKKQVQNE